MCVVVVNECGCVCVCVCGRCMGGWEFYRCVWLNIKVCEYTPNEIQ